MIRLLVKFGAESDVRASALERLTRLLAIDLHIVLGEGKAGLDHLLLHDLARAANLHLHVLADLLLMLSRVDGGHERRHPPVLLVVVHKHLACLVVQTRLRERVDQETSDHLEDCSDVPGLRIPVSLESVNANLAFERDIGMEDFGREVTYTSQPLRTYLSAVSRGSPPRCGGCTGTRLLRTESPRARRCQQRWFRKFQMSAEPF